MEKVREHGTISVRMIRKREQAVYEPDIEYEIITPDERIKAVLDFTSAGFPNGGRNGKRI